MTTTGGVERVSVDLNERQQAYLRPIYAVDKDEERTAGLRTCRRRGPAAAWRWLPYIVSTIDDVYSSTLGSPLKSQKLVDRGTGSTFTAMAERGVILVEYRRDPLEGLLAQLLGEAAATASVRRGRCRRSIEPPATADARRPRGQR